MSQFSNMFTNETKVNYHEISASTHFDMKKSHRKFRTVAFLSFHFSLNVYSVRIIFDIFYSSLSPYNIYSDYRFCFSFFFNFW